MTEVLHDFPGYDVVEPIYSPFRRAYVLHAGMELADARKPMRHYMISSVASSAIKDGDCPIAAVERARGFGHKLQFVFALGSMISNPPPPKGRYVGVFTGETVYHFEGRYIRFEPAPNNNLRIVDLGDDYAPALADNREVAA